VRDKEPLAAGGDGSPRANRGRPTASRAIHTTISTTLGGRDVALNEREIARILARHGIPDEADEVSLVALLAERGWQAQVEAPLSDDPRRGARGRRYRALAFRRETPSRGADAYLIHEHRRATGDSPEAALRRVLASVLDRQDSADGDPGVVSPPPPAPTEEASPA
jgi:hypothetical protein